MFEIIGKSNCPACIKAKTLLSRCDQAYLYSDYTINEAAYDKLMAVGAKSVPQVWKDGQHLGGFNELEQYVLNNCME